MPVHRVCEQNALFATPPGLDRIHIFFDEIVLFRILVKFERQRALLEVEGDFVVEDCVVRSLQFEL